jgi:uncharacterized protein
VITRRHFIQLGIAGAATFFSYSAFGVCRQLEITYHSLLKPALTNPFRLVQLSDLHMGSETTDYESIAKALNSLDPDLLVFTGDTFDDRDDVAGFYQFFEAITVSCPRYTILGNWDYASHLTLSEVKKHFKAVHLELLVNHSTNLSIKRNDLLLTGLDDLRMGNPSLKKSLKGEKFNHDTHLLLHHCPGEFHRVAFLREKYPNEIPAFDLVLAGHTHGGQFSFGGYMPILPAGAGGYSKGWYEKAGIPMYVNRGLGTTRIPMRFGSVPEISVFDFSPK